MSKQANSPLVQDYTLDADESPSQGVYSVVAAVENCSPLDLEPLAKTTDPDALDALLTGDTRADRIEFEYCGYEVTATPDEICVRDSSGVAGHW